MVVAKTRLGQIRGVDRNKSASFLGIPYAAPPLGELRWRPPQKPAGWVGVYDGTVHPNRGFQAPFPDDLMPPGGIPGDLSEDMLYLNVHTPRADKKKRPVMVWIHGGGYTLGSANDFDPYRMVQKYDVVIVCINYRLGIFGFLDLSRYGPEYAGSGSLGFQDQIAALKWVRDNIADYGGDPQNVTICGGSAGAGSVLALFAAPTAKGLFHKAIAISPLEVNRAPLDVITPCATALKMDEQAFFSHIRSLSGEELFKFQTDAGIGTSACVDGVIIVKPAHDAVRAGINAVPLLTGCTIAEGPMITAGVIRAMGSDPAVFQFMEAGMTATTGAGDAVRYVRFLDKIDANESPEGRLNRVWFDYFRSHALRTAEALSDSGFPAWVYTFALPTEHEYGPTHGSDVTFAFNALDPANDGEMRAYYRNSERTRKFAALWSETLVRFMRTGSPNWMKLPRWPAYDSKRRACLVLKEKPEVVENPDGNDALTAYGMI